MKYALIIGNDRYTDAKLARLKTPSADAQALVRVLRDQKIGSFDEVKPLINKTESQISRAISTFLTNKRPDDLVLIYFSGHGVLDDRGRLFLALKDTQTNLLNSTAIPSSFIADEMDSCRSKRQILILDCCHSGAFGRGMKGGKQKAVTEATFEGNGTGRFVLTASDSTEFALEGDQVITETELSLFTHFLLKGLQTGEADTNYDGSISLDEWYDYAYEQVLATTPKQTPNKWSYRQHGDVIVAKNPFSSMEITNAANEKPKREVTEIVTEKITGGLSAKLVSLLNQFFSKLSISVKSTYVRLPLSLRIAGFTAIAILVLWAGSFAILKPNIPTTESTATQLPVAPPIFTKTSFVATKPPQPSATSTKTRVPTLTVTPEPGYLIVGPVEVLNIAPKLRTFGQLAAEKYSVEERNKMNNTLTFTVNTTTDVPILWRWFWCAANDRILEQNMAKISIIFEADGRALPEDQLATVVFENPDPNYEGWKCRTFETVLRNWKPGTYKFIQTMQIASDINDGAMRFEAGTKIYEYTVHITTSSVIAKSATP